MGLEKRLLYLVGLQHAATLQDSPPNMTLPNLKYVLLDLKHGRIIQAV